MSNETKRNVLEKLTECYAEVSDAYTDETGSPYYCDDEPNYLDEYAGALPDDLPVIPKEVSDYIRKTTAPGKNGLIEVFCSLADDIRAVGHDNIYKWELWMLNNQAAIARAWVLGVWRVEETGEIVKLEEEK